MFKSKLIPYLEASFTAVVWGASFIATKAARFDFFIHDSVGDLDPIRE